MARKRLTYYAFNRGLISSQAIARVDLKRPALSAETMTNWMTRVLGSMMLRPGLKYIGATLSSAAAKFLPFIFSTSDTALLELTNGAMRVWISDTVLTRVSVSSAVTNGNFDTDVSSWTDSDESGAASVWVAGGYLGLTGDSTGVNAAIRYQTITVAAADQSVEHALRIVIQRGPVTLRVGSTTTGDDYITETSLGTGTHSLAFTPTGDFTIQFSSRLKRQTLVSSCTVEASGVVSITAPWLTADLSSVRAGVDSQSGDVVFVACEDYQQHRIERRAARSWSVVRYQSDDGPFRIQNTGPITLTAAALSGNTTLTASAALFKSTNAPGASNDGSLFKLISAGQKVTASVTAQNQFTSAIEVTGTTTQRPFTIIRSGAWVATVTLQRSFDTSTGPWTDVTTYTTNATISFDDALANQIAYYRIGVKTGDYTSGTVGLELNYSGGSITGVCRVTAYTSPTVVDVEVLTDFGATSATDNWAEGEWSDRRGWPTSGTFYEGRCWWAGKNGVWGSVSDAFDGFDEETEGDSGPIARTIGSGPVDVINWILPLQRLLLGAQGAEFSARSTALDEPLTPSNFNLKPASNQGSGGVEPVKVDSRGMFVQRGGTRVFELAFSPDVYDYGSTDLTALNPTIGQPQIVRMAVQRQPDTRIHCVLSDGTVAVLVHDRAENVLAWLKITSTGASGLVEDVVVLPGVAGENEDQVYYVVNRTVNSATVRYLEKWAMEEDCVGGTTNLLADSYITYSGAATTTLTGLTHLEGATVVVWGNGKDLGTKVVSSGQITGLSEAVTTAVVGLGYTAQWKSAKLGQALSVHKHVDHIGLVLANTHYQGLEFGPDFTNMDYLPLVDNGTAVAADSIYSTYDREPIEFPGTWDTDARVCLQATAPRPCTVLATVIDGELYE
ncbi:MAG: phage tail protein [Bellilinea sp.]